jgi:RNA polymerase sigma factor (sigma-70 family)
MAEKALQKTLDHLRKVAGQFEDDAQLLHRFVAERDKTACELLVHRHSGPVARICWHILRHKADADDAFQATFLVFFQKAASIRGSVGGWLYRVAVRVALAARKRRAATFLRTQPLRYDPVARGDGDLRYRKERQEELRELLAAELPGLSTNDRAVVALYYYCGISQNEVARQLGCSEGAVATRLSRARKHLHHRLAQRGVTLAACLAAVGAVQKTASAAVPVGLILTTAKAALGTAAASSGVTALLAAGLQGPTFYKPKIAAALLILAVSAGLGGTLAMLPGPPPTDAGVPLPDGTSPDNRTAARRTEPRTKPLAIVGPQEERRLRRESILRDQVAPRVAAALQKLSGSVRVTKTWVDEDQTGHLLADWQLENTEKPAKVDIKYEIDRNSLEFWTDLWNGEMRHISFQKPIILFRVGRYEKSVTFGEEAEEIYKAFDLLRTRDD